MAYSSPGHVNDMDILQVGRGKMTFEENKSHFTMWSIMNSPLILGNDLRTMSQETLDLVTNKEVIALNQDKFGYQARRLKKMGDLEIWAKPLISSMSGEVAVVLFNRSDKAEHIAFDLNSVGINAADGYKLRDLWKHENKEFSKSSSQSFEVPAHGVITLKVTGKSKPFNVFQESK